eukprot:10877300-Ditylum_brightwellii.AAC.1
MMLRQVELTDSEGGMGGCDKVEESGWGSQHTVLEKKKYFVGWGHPVEQQKKWRQIVVGTRWYQTAGA